MPPAMRLGEGASSPAQCSRATPAARGTIIEHLLWDRNFNYAHSNPSNFTDRDTKGCTQGIKRALIRLGSNPGLSDPRAWTLSSMLGQSQGKSEGRRLGVRPDSAPPTHCPRPMSRQWRAPDGSRRCGLPRACCVSYSQASSVQQRLCLLPHKTEETIQIPKRMPGI